MGIWDYNRRIDRSADPAKKEEQVDGNGVSSNAHSALAATSNWYGEPLPSDLKRKYEGSLGGADLSSVRVHRSAESQTAAKAVGAKAYTVGQDIHFGEGQYNPSSSEGEHLLAHEVAHTVQQQGGIKRLQLKDIAVSQPTDSHEVEADRAADAMVAGKQAAVAGAPVAVHRKKKEVGAGSGPGKEGSAGFDFAIPVMPEKEVAFFKVGAKLGGSVGVTLGPAEEKEDQNDKVTVGIGGSHEAEEDGGKSNVALTLEAEHKFKAKPFDCEITTNGNATVTPKGVSLGIGVKLTHPVGPFKVTVEPLHVDILKWEAGKEPEFGSVSCSLAVAAPPLEYILSDGRKASLTVASKLEIGGAVTPSSFLEWLAKRYGEDVVADLLASAGEGLSGAEILSTAVALAPAAVSLGVGAVSMVACAEAGARGDLDRRLEEGAIDTFRANMAYAVLMSGGDTTDNVFGPDAGGKGPRQMRAELRAISDLSILALKQGISLTAARKQLHKDKTAFTRLVKAGSAAYQVYLNKVADAVRDWRSNNWIYASGSTEADDIASSEKIVRAKLFGDAG